ncbi:MAG: SBBP repeat-containing protein, partial [Spirochaetes bacterium]|nr:SBBP repeat-containing protein [Spirochaetota bacterium]
FWIKGDANYNNVIAQIGLAGDSCGTIMNVDNGLDDKFNVTTSWVQHYIPLIGKDMSSVSRGFKIGMWNPIVAANIYVDDIRYEQYVFTNAGYRWTKQLGGTEKDEGRSVALDGSGNVYFTGYFRSTVNFQEDWGGTDSRLSAGENDIFITKVNSDGTYGWTKQIGGTGDDTGFAIACDSSGNIYITGSFEGTVNFAQDWLGNDTKGSSGNSDIFITKINANGTYGWTKKMGGTGYDGSYGMALDNSDNIYITGCYQYSVNFRQDWGGADTNTNAGSDDIFISKVDSDGINYYWTRRMGGSGSDCGYSLATNSSGDIYVTGCYQNTVNFGQDWSTPDIKTNAGSEDIFVSRIGQNGTSYEWTKRIGGAYSECAYGITTDKNGHVYVTGSFLGTVDFRSDWGGSDPKTSIFNSNDIFLIRINADDSYGWTKRIGNSCPYDRGEAVTTDRSNNIYVTGSFQYTVNFAQDWGGADYKSSNGMWYDAFAMRVNADGTYGSTRRFGGTSHDCGYGIVFSDTGIGYITGFFAVTANFAQDWFDVDYKSSKGLYDIFLMRFEGL